ncbi:MAG: prolyl oligopeptidase family serine peptidase [Gemmatimonadaceae bacterium]|nr:prolyl oligopeptidase family serine peptidase [Gemmatimonadaceae bacterium]
MLTRSLGRAALASTTACAALYAAPMLLSAQTAPAANATTFDFSIANMMRGPEHYGREPQNVRWHADGQWLYFQWTPAGSVWNAQSRPYRVRAVAGSAPEVVTDAHMDSVAPLLADGILSPDRRTSLVNSGGDLYLVDVRRATARALTSTVVAETNARWSADGSRVLFVRDGNAFSIELATGATTQLTDIRNGPAPRDSARATGQRGALERQQRELLDVIRDRAREDSLQRIDRDAARTRRMPIVYLPAGERLVGVNVSPSLRTAIVLTASGAGGGFGGGGGGFGGGGGGAGGGAGQARNTIVPNYVTGSGYTEDIPSRSKVGDATGRSRAWRLILATGVLQPLHVINGDSSRVSSQVRFVDWSADGSAAMLAGFTPDFKWRYLSTVADTGRVKIVEALNDTAWVGGPCGGCMGWLPNGQVWFASEASGYAHLYRADRDGANKVTMTSGSWEVERAEIQPDGATFLLHTSEESPFVRHAYRMPVLGGARTKLTREHGGHSIVPSPDGLRFADVYSTSNMPPELYVARGDGTQSSRLTTSTSVAFRSRNWIKPEIVKIPASDGIQVPARIYKPQDMGVQPNGAAVIFVHGAGYLHNVHDFWSSYAREYMFNQLLASKGYVVLDIDYRASAGYGRDWRTAIYRWMGGRDLQDHVDASAWLKKTYNIDPERVGLYGGSYGGFMTLMALFTAPKSFGAGAALRSVTDWAHYNNGYTGNILNYPQNDTLAYRRSSPIFFAEGLEDPLLMAHGMVDTNVHFQDIVRLSQRLIELGKTGWELAVYPVEDHGFTRPDSWTDEYRRIFELFERSIGQPSRSGASGR